MAEQKFTLTIYEGNATRTVIVNQPTSSKLIGIGYWSTDNEIEITFANLTPVSFKFPSSSLRTTFINSLITGFETATSFALDNRGPVATTTSTTAAP